MSTKILASSVVLTALLLASCATTSPTAAAQPSPAPAAATAAPSRLAPLEHPSGSYDLDPHHVSVTWRVSHMGFSMYTGRFATVTGTLTLNAEDPLASSVVVTIPTASVDTGYRNAQGAPSFDQTIATRAFGSEANPEIRFVSGAIASADGRTGTVTGDLTFNGVTRPVSMDVTFNGGRFVALTQKYTLGFSARTTIQRSAFGVTNWASAVGDDVEIIIEAEFQRQ
ncbi:MAG: YceI family protein [Caulobacterales bacterium]